LAIILAIALWLVFINPRLVGVIPAAPSAVAPATATPAANAMIQNEMADEAAQKAEAAAKAKAAKAKAEALAAQRAAEAAQVDALEKNMTPAQNRLNEDYAAEVGDTRPAASDSANASTSPDRARP
jgi:hypothetical protein